MKKQDKNGKILHFPVNKIRQSDSTGNMDCLNEIDDLDHWLEPEHRQLEQASDITLYDVMAMIESLCSCASIVKVKTVQQDDEIQMLITLKQENS